MARTVKLNRAGLLAKMRSPELRRVVLNRADEVARAISNQGLVASSAGKDSSAQIVAKVEEQVTDRVRGVVVVNHPAARAMQARHGMFTKAASAAGLKVKSR